MLTNEQKICNYETLKHIHRVRDLLNICIKKLLDCGSNHDKTKLETPEVELFAEVTPRLANMTYGSEEYISTLREIRPALNHHYAKNSHHPEHFPNKVNDMSLINILEMFCDWKAASERHNDGNLLKSIEHNANRYELSPQLVKILQNTAKEFDRE